MSYQAILELIDTAEVILICYSFLVAFIFIAIGFDLVTLAKIMHRRTK